MTDKLTSGTSSNILIYQAESGKTKIEVRLDNETVWLTQKSMAELFQTSIPNVNMHLKNIFEESELESDSVIKDFLITTVKTGSECVGIINL